MNSGVEATTGVLVGRATAATSVNSEYHSWGQYPSVSHRAVHRVEWADQITDILQSAAASSLLPYGLGRSYGDSCLNAGRDLIDCSRLNRFLAADFKEGWVRCEGGASLASILALAVPKGWFLPVTPGTKHVTIGGAIANDVHGKNHHRAGTFGCHVRKICLYRSDRGMVLCSPQENADLFAATVGGLGLTGVILWGEIKLTRIPGSDLETETFPFRSMDQFLALTQESDQAYEHTVAWIDCMSRGKMRGLFFRGNHRATSNQHSAYRLKIPFAFPDWTLNRWAIRTFNAAYFMRNRWGGAPGTVSYESFFYPLDSLLQWNLLYGKRGFLQYQCVVPEESSSAIALLLELVSKSGLGSFLGVLKRFGDVKSPGLLSFPRPGLTLCLDFAMRGAATLNLLQQLDEVVMKNRGALYPAKDARMSPAMFEASFPNWRELQPYVDDRFSSSLWRRVTGNH